MTWIRTIPREQAEGALRDALESQRATYPAEYSTPAVPGLPPGGSVVESHSLIPDALHHAFATFGALMSPDLPLARRQHEMIATVVSATNRCHYWIQAHAEFLRRVTLDESLATAIREDHTQAPVSEQDHVMLAYVAQLTRDSTQIQPSDHERLRSVGFDDVGILQITLIASWFNYINRAADALGVGRDPCRTPAEGWANRVSVCRSG